MKPHHPTMKDIRNVTGLGLATISKYVNGGNVKPVNKELLDRVVAELGYRRNEYARALKTTHTRTIGVVIPELASRFCTVIVSGVEDALRHRGYAVIVCDCRSDRNREQDAIRFLLSRNVDGLLCLPVSGDGTALRQTVDAGIPVVLFDRPVDVPGCSAVLLDNRAAAATAVNHLFQYGHRRIGLVYGDHYFTHMERRLGYRDALAAVGIPADPALECMVSSSMTGGYEGLLRLIRENPDMTAVFTINFGLTLGAYLALGEQGIRIPDDMSLIGFDNLEMSRVLTPRLTAIAQPMDEIISNTADLMLEALENGECTPRTVVLEAALVEGASVADLRQRIF